MSTIKHPLGRQSSKVYRRRRLVVGLGLLAVLVIVILLIVRPGAGNGESTADSPSAGSAGATEATADAAETPVPAASAAEGAPCEAGQVQVAAVTDAVRYEAGQQPQLSLSLTNTGTNSCLINAGTAAQVFTITSGTDTYWTSTDCQSESSDSSVTLKPGIVVSTSTPIDWDRTRSAPDTCDAATREGVPAGGAAYNLSVTVDGITSAAAKQILLF